MLQPLGMTGSTFELDEVAATSLAAVSLYAPGTDVARFARALVRENPVLEAATLREMQSPQVGTAGTGAWKLRPGLRG